MSNDPCVNTADELVTVLDFLNDGDLVAVGAGNMVGLYRVHNDSLQGEAYLQFEGVGALTGATNVIRKVPR